MIREWPCYRGSIPGRSIDVLDKESSSYCALGDLIGGRCSSVGSRLSTKQTYVYIGDADSATPASKYPPLAGRRGTPQHIHEPRTKRALRLDSSSRISCLIFISFHFILSVVSSSSLSSSAPHRIALSSPSSPLPPLPFSSPPSSSSTTSSNVLPLFHLFSSSFSLRHRHRRPLRRRNVPIKSESHVLPISRQLNLVHAHIARLLRLLYGPFARVPANFVSIDEPSMNIACRTHNVLSYCHLQLRPNQSRNLLA